MLEPRKFSLEELLKKNIQYKIPEYQRAYDWKHDTEVADLISDFKACLEATGTNELFLGTMIADVSKEKEDKIVEVIDGQQRLTTIYILVIALRNYAKDELSDLRHAEWYQRIISGDSAPSSKDNKVQLIASESIVDVFNRMCESDWEGDFPDRIDISGRLKPVKRQNNKIKKIYEYCYSSIDTMCEGKKKKFQILHEQIFENTFLIKIDIENKAEAFEIFERTNARGRGLEISDLLKNFLFSNEKKLKDKNISDIWSTITDNAGNSILRMLKYFFISRKGHVASRDLYRQLRLYLDEIGVNQFIDELKEFSEFYAAFFSKEESKFIDWLCQQGFKNDNMYLQEFLRSAGALKLFGVTQTVPLIYSAVRSNIKNGNDKKTSKNMLSFIRLLESYHFVNNKICNRIGNEVEQLYAKFSMKFYSPEDFNVVSSELEKELLTRIASRDQFVADIKSIIYENASDKPIIRYIFDKIVNDKVKQGARLKFLDYYAHVNKVRSEYDIEHILSQSSKTSNSEYSFIDEIGNLIIFPKQINGILSNKPYKEKMDILSHPNKYKNNIRHVPDYIKEFIDIYGKQKEWSQDEISRRTTDIANNIYTICVSHYKYK